MSQSEKKKIKEAQNHGGKTQNREPRARILNPAPAVEPMEEALLLFLCRRSPSISGHLGVEDGGGRSRRETAKRKR